MNTKAKFPIHLFLKGLIRAIGIGVMSYAVFMSTGSSLRGQAYWYGSSGSNGTNWFDISNWTLNPGYANPPATIPGTVASGTTSVVYLSNMPASRVIDMLNTSGSNTKLTVQELQLLDPSSSFTLNIKGSDTATLTLELTRAGFTRGGSVGNDDRASVVNLGKNAIISYLKPLGTDNNNSSRVVDLRMTDNAILDISGFTKNNRDGAQVEFDQLRGTEGTKINLGINALKVGTGLATGTNIIMSAITAGNAAAAPGTTASDLYTSRGRLLKSGAGTVIVSGSNIFDTSAFVSGSTTTKRDAMIYHYSGVDNGTLVILGNIGHVRMNGNDAATLSGGTTTKEGLVEGDVLFQRGILTGGMGASKKDVGTLHIKGNVNMTGSDKSNSATDADLYAPGTQLTTLAIDLGVAGTYDKILVDGYYRVIQTSNALFKVAAPAGEIYAGKYTVLTAGGGVSGAGLNALLTNTKNTRPASLGVDFVAPSIEGNSIVFSITQKSFAALPELSNSQVQIGSYLDTLVSQAVAHAGGNLNDPTIYPRVIGLMNAKTNLTSLMRAMNQLTPQYYGTFYAGAVGSMDALNDAITQRFRRHEIAAEQGFKLYFSTAYEYSTLDATEDTEKAKFKAYRYTLGSEKTLNEVFLVGASLDMSTGDYTSEVPAGTYELTGYKDATDVSSYNLNVYLAGKTNRWSYGGYLFYGFDKYDAKRNIQLTNEGDYAAADFNGTRYGLGAWVQYSIATKYFNLKPYANGYWMQWELDSFSEKANAAVAMNVASQSAHALQTRLGFRIDSDMIAKNIRMKDLFFRPYIDVSWVHQWNAGSRELDYIMSGVKMRVETPEGTADGIRASAGILVDLGKRWNADFNFTGQWDGVVSSGNVFQGSVGYRF